MKHIDLPVDEIVERYTEGGEGTPALGSVYGVSYMTILRRLHAAGVKMRPRGAPLGNKYREGTAGNRKRGGPLSCSAEGYLCSQSRGGEKYSVHRACWEAYHGRIPSWYVVHHNNGNRTDNRIENLACMLCSDHTSMHRKKAQEAKSETV